MKILIYTDLHCSYNSSILPLYTSEKTEGKMYTTRLDMIVKTGEWIAQIAKENDVDMLVNGGDTFDSTTVRTEELDAITQFFKSFDDLCIPHIVVVGNHEKVNDEFNAVKILSGFKNVAVCQEPTKVNEVLSVLPYMDSKKVTPDLLKPLSNKLLVSHVDIQGSCLRDSYILDAGVNPELFAEYFKLTANGHLHTAEKLETSQNQVWNIGGVSSISFVDNQDYVPRIVIYDSKTGKFKAFKNPHSILFRKIKIDSLKELKSYLNKKDATYRYALTVKYSNYEQHAEIIDILSKDSQVVAYKTINAYMDTVVSAPEIEVTSVDIKSKFVEFLNEKEVELKYSAKDYLEILSDCEVTS